MKQTRSNRKSIDFWPLALSHLRQSSLMCFDHGRLSAAVVYQDLGG